MSHINECGVDLGPVDDWPVPREHYVIGLWTFQGPVHYLDLTDGTGIE